MTTQSIPKADTFSLRTPYLSDGRTTDLLSETEDLWVHVKVYAQGGENALHCHEDEDHAFVVLEGQATYWDQDRNEKVVNKNEGIMLPKGAFYYFQSSGDTNLVLLRVGAGKNPYKDRDAGRMGPDGLPLPAHSAENKHVTGVPIPSKFFGD